MVGAPLDVGLVADVPATVGDPAVALGVSFDVSLLREPHALSRTSEEMAVATRAQAVRFMSALVSELQAVVRHAATAAPSRSIAIPGGVTHGFPCVLSAPDGSARETSLARAARVTLPAAVSCRLSSPVCFRRPGTTPAT